MSFFRFFIKFDNIIDNLKKKDMYREDYEGAYSREKQGDDVFSKPVRAGKRTYFFDVKSTKGGNDFFLTITESRRRTEADERFSFDKHKIFLYKEDFDKFAEGLQEVIEYIRTNCLSGASAKDNEEKPYSSDVEF